MNKHENKFPKHLWEGVRERFAGVTSIEKYNEVRQSLFDEWAVEHDGKTYNVILRDRSIELPYYLHLVNCLDSSELVSELAVNFVPKTNEEDENNSN
jgi:hypothetical protein